MDKTKSGAPLPPEVFCLLHTCKLAVRWLMPGSENSVSTQVRQGEREVLFMLLLRDIDKVEGRA